MRTRRSRRFVGFNASGSAVETMEVRLLLSSVFQQEGHVAIIAKHDALGGVNGVLGVYASGAIVTTDGMAVYKYFSNGLIVWSPATGAHEVHGIISRRYRELGGPNGKLGLPISDEKLTRNSDGRINGFQRGMIAFPLGATEASAISGNIAAKYYTLGGAWGFLGFPISNEISVPSQNYRMNTLKSGILVASPVTGIHEVHGAILSRYNELGGPSGILGLPISDEMDTPEGDGRISTFQYGTIVHLLGAERAVETATLPRVASMDVQAPSTFREGDVFTATVMNATPGRWAYVDVVGDGNTILHHFPAVKVDANGNATLALRLPYILARGRSVDGFTLRMVSGPVTTDFPVAVNEGQRINLSADSVEEGSELTVNIRNGIGESQTIIQLIHDNNTVVHEWGYMQTNGSGEGTYGLTIPTLLPYGSRIDAYGIRVIHGGLVNDKRFTVTEGFRAEVGHKKTREGHTFPVGIRNAPENAKVRIEWYLDGSKRATLTDFRTDGEGNGNFTVTTPQVLRGGAEEDMFEIQISVEGDSALFVFGMLVKKQTGSSDPGGTQMKSSAPDPSASNSAPGVIFNTPGETGVTSVREITPAENSTLASEPPAVTIQERMKHQLVILCYGADQFPGKNAGSDNPDDRPGMDHVFEAIEQTTGRSHVLRLQSGNKDLTSPKQSLINADRAFEEAKSLIAQTISVLQNQGQTIESVVLAGYSWGGGMARRLADWIVDIYGVELSGLIYVDAVNHGLVGHETDLPSTRTRSLLNIYQNKHTIFDDYSVAGDGWIANPRLINFDGKLAFRRYRNYDTDVSNVDITTHLTIDNRQKGAVAEFILGVVNGWYDENRS